MPAESWIVLAVWAVAAPLAAAVRRQDEAHGALSRIHVIGVDSFDKASTARSFMHAAGVTFPVASEEIDDAEYLVNHVGKLGYLQLGFAHQGVMFIFETSTEWYERFQELMEAVTDLGGIVVDDHDSDD